METYCVSCKKYTANKNSSVKKKKKRTKIDQCSFQIVLFMARKNQILLKIKNLEMISLK